MKNFLTFLFSLLIALGSKAQDIRAETKRSKVSKNKSGSSNNKPGLFISAGYISGEKLGNSAVGELKIDFPSKNIIRAGFGIEVMKFKNLNKPYLPFFLDINILSGSDYSKPIFYAILQPGYSIYSDKTEIRVDNRGSRINTSSTGDLYFGAGIGLLFPSKKEPKVNIQAKFNRSYFNNDVSATGVTQYSQSRKDGYSSGSFLIGLAF